MRFKNNTFLDKSFNIPKFQKYKNMKIFLPVLLLFLFHLEVSLKTVSGTVTDNSGHALPGVNVIIKGSSSGTQTNKNGHYEIEAKKGDILIYSYLGFKTEQREVKDGNIINVKLEPDTADLEEVIFTGYNNVSGKVQGIRIRGRSGLPTPQTESYRDINENIFKHVATAPLSTFSIDVDKAGYSNIRRMINNGQEIPKDAVKIEEMINYFDYDYPQPTNDAPFSINTEIAETPWNPNTRLVKIGLQGKIVPLDDIPASNLVFLIDVSGSMNHPEKLPLLKSAFELLTNQLRPKDKVAIVVYAGAAGLVLPSTSGSEKSKILAALEELSAGGSTAGGQGIQLAYEIAKKNFIEGGNNRVILATDGDFNVGASSDSAMEELIVEKRETGIFLTVLGFGMGNYQDSKLETLAGKGNGNHAYIDSMQEAQRVLGTEFGGTIYTIAKDVKVQVEFNPKKVKAYRLIGYENRMLEAEDFNNDRKDAGELGSGHTVTAIYEIIPVGVESKFLKEVDALKYSEIETKAGGNELLTVKFRYKDPDGEESKLIVKTVEDEKNSFRKTSKDFKFSAAVALFGTILRESKYSNGADYQKVISLAEQGRGEDENGYRAEFIRLVRLVN